MLEHGNRLPWLTIGIPIRMSRPATAGETLGRSPLMKTFGAHASCVECVPCMPA